MKIKLNNDYSIYNFSLPFVIAELGSNHNGNMELAKKLILEAKEAGAHCVKFQSWSKDTIFSRKKYEDNFFIADDYRNRTDFTMEEIVEKYDISEQELIDMKMFCDGIGIQFASTPFSIKEADFLLDELNAPFIKVASMDLNNYPFLSYIAKKNKPIILSTGLSELHEIDKAIKTIENEQNNQIAILHCVATYPPEDKNLNLRNITTLMTNYPDYPIGYSDHSIGTAIPLASVALGACIIEKHFTLDKNMEGWDHKVSATKNELKEIVDGSKRISMALGSSRILSTESQERKNEFRRSIVLTKNILKNHRIKIEDVTFKRPGTGFSPENLEFIVGRAVNKDLKYDHILTIDDLI